MRKVRETIGGLGNILFKNAYIWAQMREGNIPDIYVQSPKYFDKYKEEIKTMYGQGIGDMPYVALHIRRGDYLKAAQFHTNLWDTGYYHEAVKFFPEGTGFLVFCKDNQEESQDKDDREWCERNMRSLGVNYVLYEHGIETDDLNAMASCSKGIIGANSSFSWWAAYLSPHKSLKVFPKEENWFVDGKVRTKLLDSWITL